LVKISQALLFASPRRIVTGPLTAKERGNARLADVLSGPARHAGGHQRVRATGFFSFSRAALELIARRRSGSLKLGLALRELDISTPDRVSLRALYARGRPCSPPAASL
jgi:hypothetical protein